MWKKIFILVVLGYIFLSSKYFLQNYVYAATNEQGGIVTGDSLSSNPIAQADF